MDHILYTSLFFCHAEGEKVARKIYEQLVSDGIPMHKMASLIRDGPNINKTVFQKMNELITQENPEFPGLVDLVHVASMSFIMHLEKVLSSMEKKWISFAWIFTHSSSTVQLGVKTSGRSSLKWKWNFAIFNSTLR